MTPNSHAGRVRPSSRIAAVATLVLVTCGALVALAPPAAAHGIGGTQPTNYEVTITGVDPAVRGLHVEVIDLGSRLELTNDTGHDVVVLGYDDEPYLRIGPRGVFENVKSPATFLNRGREVTAAPPASADSDAPPVWRRVSGGQVARWHDHRAHWMGNEAPPSVRRAPDRRRVIEHWVVPMRAAGRAVEVHGVLAWEPPPSPWPAMVIAVALAAVVIGLSRTRRWRAVLVAALAALTGCAAAHTLGHWVASTSGFGTNVTESLYGAVGVALGIVALAWSGRRGVDAAVPLVLVASVFLLVATGLGDIATLGHSQVPSSFPAPVARFVVTCTIGLGVGVAVAAALRLRTAGPPGVRRSRARPDAAAATSVTS